MDSEISTDLVQRYSPRKKALVGVSGGRDSVVLLHLLKAAGFRHLVLCHLNHRLRGRSSGNDARFVRRLARDLAIECEIDSCDVAGRAKADKISIETAARRARHEFFARVARTRRCYRLFLAHHADDQVETVLHQLFRGSGLKGLAGMAPVSRLEMASGSGRETSLDCLRPLLGVWREAIDDYVATHGLEYREDISNADPGLSTRNRWRHELLPSLNEALGRDPRPAVARLSEIARDEEAAVSVYLESRWTSLITGENGQELRLVSLRELPVAWQRRALKRWLDESGIPEVSFDLVERVRGILPAQGASSARVNLPGGSWARRRAGILFIERPPGEET